MKTIFNRLYRKSLKSMILVKIDRELTFEMEAYDNQDEDSCQWHAAKIIAFKEILEML